MTTNKPGWKVAELDYSQAELRVASVMSQDPNMLEAYKSGSDLHTKTMDLMFPGFEPKDADDLKRHRTYAKSCFAGDVEILTSEGFVKFEDYDGFTKVAQYNQNSQEISYVKPLDFRMIPSQPISTFENEYTSLKLTNNHECLVVNYSNDDGDRVVTKIPYEDIPNLPQDRENLFINAGFVKRDSIESEYFTRVLSMILFEGYINKTDIKIKLSYKKERKIERCRLLLNTLGIDYNESLIDNSNTTQFTISDFNFITKIKRYIGKDGKLNRYIIKNIYCETFFRESILWGGYTYEIDTQVIVLPNNESADILQEMAITSGIRAVTEDKGFYYSLTFSFNEGCLSRFLSSEVSTSTEHNENTDVYCVTVPEHNIVVRYNGKVSIQGPCNFGFIYGMGAKSYIDYARGYGLNLTLDEAEEFRENFIKAYPSLPRWWDDMKDFARDYGYSITMTGRKRFLPDIWSRDFKRRASAERQSVNSPVQGLASDLCISAMADVVFDETLDHTRFRVMGTIHDAILIEVEESYAEELTQKVAWHMANPSILEGESLGVPLIGDIEIGNAWGDHG